MNNDQILEKVEPMIIKAENEGLWFYKKFCFFEIWLSPNELREVVSSGNTWCRVTWSIRNPDERLNELQASIHAMTEEINSIKEERKKITIKEC